MDIEGNEILPLSERMYINPNPADGCFFSEGKHPVMNDEGKWGYIDSFGQIVSECKWNQVRPFSNGLARVYVDDKMALIDSSGTVVWGKNVEPSRGNESYRALLIKRNSTHNGMYDLQGSLCRNRGIHCIFNEKG